MRTSSIATRGEIDSEGQAWATDAVVPSSSLPTAAADNSSTSPESKSTPPTRSLGFRIGGGMREEETTGEWLLRALQEVRGRIKTGGLDLDDDVISGLVSYCEMAPPEDAQEYLIVSFFLLFSFFYLAWFARIVVYLLLIACCYYFGLYAYIHEAVITYCSTRGKKTH